MQRSRQSLLLYYASLTALIVTTALHQLYDAPVSGYDWITHTALTLSVALVTLTTVFIFYPTLRKLRRFTGTMQTTMAQLDLLKNVATAANEAGTMNEGLQAALDNICAYTGWQVGHIYMYVPDREVLASAGVWHLQDPVRCAPFKAVSEATELKPHEGFAGEVFADATPMWVLDVADSAVYSRKRAAVDSGLKAGFAFPIFVQRKAVAVMEFYSFVAEIPSEELLSTMANIGRQLGATIERGRFQEQARLLTTVIESANDGVIITKSNLSPPGPEIVYVNEAFTRISGYAPQEVIGRNPRFLQNEFTKQETLQALKRSLEAGQPFKDELLNSHKDGSHYWLEISVVPIRDDAGKITHYAALERDITARKKEEIEYKNMWLQLKRANLKAEAVTKELQESLVKAEEANKAKSDFLANMSHELRTPMNGVLGMSQLLAETELDAEQRLLVSTINSSGENLLLLLNDILDFSKIEAGALELEHIPFALRETILSTVHLLRPGAQSRNIELITDCAPDLPGYIMGDPGRVRQVLTNLVSNAIKFTEHGYVHVVVDTFKENGQPQLHVRVEDTGIGIPAEKLATIFEKFTQGDASVTRKYGGTGLGLAITKQLVQMMNGQIGVNSVAGKGSTFWFILPCTEVTALDTSGQGDPAQSRKLALTRQPIAAARALLVEDHEINRTFAEKLLRKFGLRHIDFAENGVQALKRYRETSYDVIFMDCQMPEMDGYQATGQIRALEAGKTYATPIIAMTANAMMGDREKCLKAGMDDYISKPLRTRHLKTILQSLFILDAESEKYADSPEATDTSDAQPAIDLAQLRIFTDGDLEEERSLLSLYLEQADEMLAILRASVRDPQQNEAWKSAAHRLKGSSGNLGATRLFQLCQNAELQFVAPPREKANMLSGIEEATAAVRSFAAEHYGLAHS